MVEMRGGEGKEGGVCFWVLFSLPVLSRLITRPGGSGYLYVVASP